jgi:uncharacterized membrane protein YiaA
MTAPLLLGTIIFSLLVGWWGRNHKFGFWGYFFASALLTPVVGAILVLASSPNPKPAKPAKTQDQPPA